jgi:hypothetical protein
LTGLFVVEPVKMKICCYQNKKIRRWKETKK